MRFMCVHREDLINTPACSDLRTPRCKKGKHNATCVVPSTEMQMLFLILSSLTEKSANCLGSFRVEVMQKKVENT